LLKLIAQLNQYAWEALGNKEETYPPVLFDGWVGQQYLTDKTARVEKFEP
jgi:hypothetical protein